MTKIMAGRPSKNAKTELTLEDVSDKSKSKTTNKVNFNLDKERHYALKKYALENGKNVTEVLIEMIDEKVYQR